MTTVINGTSTSASAPAVVGDDGDTGVYFPSANTLALAAGGTQVSTINAYGIGLGAGTTPSSGMGITFPASQSASSNANTLDDYEEGNATIRFGNNLGNYSNVTCAYTKVGRLVTIAVNIDNYGRPAGVSTSDNITLTNLPFSMGAEATISVTNFVVGLFVAFGGTDIGGFPKSWRHRSTTSVQLQTQTSSSTSDVTDVTFNAINATNGFYCRSLLVYNTD